MCLCHYVDIHHLYYFKDHVAISSLGLAPTYDTKLTS